MGSRCHRRGGKAESYGFYDEIFISNKPALIITKLKLTTLPPEIAKFDHLKKLYISSNRLTNLPDVVYNLTKLERITAVDNQLTELSHNIENLTELRSLRISHNKLTTLPPEISSLHRLEYLDVSDNRLSTLPDSLFSKDNHPKLKGVDAINNRITADEVNRIASKSAVTAEISATRSDLLDLYRERNHNNITLMISPSFNIIDAILDQVEGSQRDNISDFIDSTSPEFQRFIQECSKTKGWKQNSDKTSQAVLRIIEGMRAQESLGIVDNITKLLYDTLSYGQSWVRNVIGMSNEEKEGDKKNLKQVLCEGLAHEVETSCGDRVALALALMTIKVEFPDVDNLEKLTLTELFEASKLDALSQILLEKAEDKKSELEESGHYFDEIEVYLGYLEMVEDFGFKLDSTKGLYTQADITEEDRYQAKQEILDQARTQDMQAAVDYVTALHLYNDNELKKHPKVQEIITKIGGEERFSSDILKGETDGEWENRMSNLATSYADAVAKEILTIKDLKSHDRSMPGNTPSDTEIASPNQLGNTTITSRIMGI